MSKRNLYYLLLLVIVVGIFPFIGRDVYYLNVMILAGLYAMASLGLCILMGYAGQISLGQNAFFAIGAYTSAVVSTKIGWPPLVGVLLGAVISSFLAVVISVPSLRLEGFYLAMATLAFAEIIMVALNELRGLTGGPFGFSGIPRFSFLEFTFDSDLKYYFLVWAIVILLLLVCLNIINSRVGRALRTLGDSERGAMLLGINVSMVKVQIFVLGAVFASMGGSFYAHYVTFISPEAFSLFFGVFLIIIIAVGGIASIWGAVIGSIVLVFFSEYLRFFKEYYLMIYGSMLALLMMFFPKGFSEQLTGWLLLIYEKLEKKMQKLRLG